MEEEKEEEEQQQQQDETNVPPHMNPKALPGFQKTVFDEIERRSFEVYSWKTWKGECKLLNGTIEVSGVDLVGGGSNFNFFKKHFFLQISH